MAPLKRCPDTRRSASTFPAKSAASFRFLNRVVREHWVAAGRLVLPGCTHEELVAAESDQGCEHAIGRHLENCAATVWPAIRCGPVEIAVAALD